MFRAGSIPHVFGAVGENAMGVSRKGRPSVKLKRTTTKPERRKLPERTQAATDWSDQLTKAIDSVDIPNAFRYKRSKTKNGKRKDTGN